jgi:Putative DNA-binding HTH domain
VNAATSLLERPVYGMAQVDRVLGLTGGTARRWIDGYSRGRKNYPPVVRLEPTGEEIVTWGEFVETRLLSEYRSAGVSLVRMRPAVDALRALFHPVYPLAHARPFLDVEGRELVRRVQDDVKLDRELQIVVVRNNQLVLTDPAEDFVRSAEFGETSKIVERL